MTKVFNSKFLGILGLGISFLILYYPVIFHMISDWLNDDNYSHGFLVPLIAGYMIWLEKDYLKNTKSKPSILGFMVLICGMGIFVIGNIGAELFMMRFSIIVTIFGLAIYIFGNIVGRKIAFPLLYLVFMIPLPAILWNHVAFPLQLFAAKLSANAIIALGIPVLRHGNILELSNTTLEVVDACSGLRSLTSLLALSAAFAYIAPLKKKSDKLVLFFSAVPIAVGVNILRLSITAIMAQYIGPELAQGFLHDFSGLLVFFVALFLFFSVYSVMNKFQKKNKI
jgi:exosortase